ncbi:MAG TPA: hypothetical protein VLC55_03155 [Burkholderiales bacterium]|nr:hypothetical protein [Burkholderiales bacterium]
MNTPSVFLAYAPRGAGLMCAVAWFTRGNDVFGWWGGARGSEFACGYFLAEDFYAGGGTRLLATEGNDLYGGWTRDYTHRQPPLDDRIPPPDEVCHELERLQFQFSHEWLVFSHDPDAAAEKSAYHDAELAAGPVLIHNRKLNKFRKDDVVWTFASPVVDRNLLEYLWRRWPLDYRED